MMNTSLSWRPGGISIPWSRDKSFGLIILTALIAFEMFNYSTTEFALADLLGDLQFGGVRWATILALAFCGMDFAGLARLYTPRPAARQRAEGWYLFGAWLLAAGMNAVLTWWGVTIALLSHATLGNALISRSVMLQVGPVFVAVMVWIIRVLMIGSFSRAGAPAMVTADLPNGTVRTATSGDGPFERRRTPAPSGAGGSRMDRPVRPVAAQVGSRTEIRATERSEPVYESVPEHC